ncbi:MAG TPA: Stp1/IreP family PP2C-type Ser/Thr phosphatase [Bacteroidetes bacterium]|nr:Stp1/IreP family PP2C-type Ser/Thr phosphatase [Bacteroidota bacterium]
MKKYIPENPLIMFWKKKNKKLNPQNKNFDMEFVLDYAVKTDTGSLRDNNEDAVKCINFNNEKKGFLAIVADGMGGHKSGEVASQMAVDILPVFYFESKGKNPDILNEAFQKTNMEILKKSHSNSIYSGMGTTCTALVVAKNKIYYAHVGDSRLYLFRDNDLIQLSKDQTLVQKMIDEGTLTKSEAINYPQKNIIWQAMGTTRSLDVQVNKNPLTLKEHDRLLLCSDGLTDLVSDMEIKQILQLNSLNMVTNCLVALAKDKGGYDNISTILIEVNKYKREFEKRDTREF